MTTENWQGIPWKEYYGTVFKIQEQIVMAYRSKTGASRVRVESRIGGRTA
jgi:hypothetical protein